ncbi:hypothetical protein MRY16398_32030 [Phytobacter sp. MRY16-398]|nr:hypothetical protein MRY16398_32030 [Phytobacter sp. MRY16-398]
MAYSISHRFNTQFLLSVEFVRTTFVKICIYTALMAEKTSNITQQITDVMNIPELHLSPTLLIQ